MTCIVILLSCMGCRITKEDAIERFERITGISLTDDMEYLAFKDDGPGEGEFSIVFKLQKPRVAELLAKPPPLGKKWENGPVDPNIGYHCKFIYDQSYSSNTHNGESPIGIGGFSNADDLLKRTDIKYCAEPYGPDKMPWHDGSLLIILPSDGTMWHSTWHW